MTDKVMKNLNDRVKHLWDITKGIPLGIPQSVGFKKKYCDKIYLKPNHSDWLLLWFWLKQKGWWFWHRVLAVMFLPDGDMIFEGQNSKPYK